MWGNWNLEKFNQKKMVSVKDEFRSWITVLPTDKWLINLDTKDFNTRNIWEVVSWIRRFVDEMWIDKTIFLMKEAWATDEKISKIFFEISLIQNDSYNELKKQIKVTKNINNIQRTAINGLIKTNKEQAEIIEGYTDLLNDSFKLLKVSYKNISDKMEKDWVMDWIEELENRMSKIENLKADSVEKQKERLESVKKLLEDLKFISDNYNQIISYNKKNNKSEGWIFKKIFKIWISSFLK